MAKSDEKRGGGGGKVFGVGLVAGLVALAAAWFGNCIPGFGVGGGAGTSSPTAPAATKADEKTPAAAADLAGLRVIVDGERCRKGDDDPQACDVLCKALAADEKADGGAITRRVEIEGTLGTHATVDGLRKCLGEQGFRDVVVRTE